jgi:glycerol-3-phosphate dehydrogenase
VSDPHKSGTEGLIRNHIAIPTSSRLLAIVGGKWTTYREMAKETVDEAVKLLVAMTQNEMVPERAKRD